jgi:hypothetical protein
MRWPEFAAAAKLGDDWRDRIQKNHRLARSNDPQRAGARLIRSTCCVVRFVGRLKAAGRSRQRVAGMNGSSCRGCSRQGWRIRGWRRLIRPTGCVVRFVGRLKAAGRSRQHVVRMNDSPCRGCARQGWRIRGWRRLIRPSGCVVRDRRAAQGRRPEPPSALRG